MKFFQRKLCERALFFLCVFCACAVHCFAALDREAFSIQNYDLQLQLDPAQHRLGVRGKIVLRNDSTTPQKIAVLQISSSLNWRSIRVGDKGVQFVTQTFTSDIDHTGALSEAIVTLSQEIAPHATVDLDISYEGVILPDATRLTRIGTPDDAALSSDWDQIDEEFTGLRGAGYVAWYPIATDVANLSEDNSLFEVLGRWKQRELGSQIHLMLAVHRDEGIRLSDGSLPSIFFSGVACMALSSEHLVVEAECLRQNLRLDTPNLLIADYQMLKRPTIEVRYLRGHDAASEAFADAAEKAAPFIIDWFGPQREKAKTADLPNPEAAPFESGALLLTPLAYNDTKLAGLAAAHQLTHASFLSFRPWINEGMAHFAQALYLEHEKNRQAALDYMGLHRSVLTQIEQPDLASRSEDQVSRSLVNTTSEELYRSKAMCVWWMLRDMLGDAALKKAIASYKSDEDKDPSYMPHLLAAQTQRDLEWFFDDWVYRDRGLPDFKVETASPRKLVNSGYMTAVTIDNLGTAGAEVPVILKFATGEVTRRIEVRAKSKATTRIETSAAPTEVVVNDGSVPESNTTNNTFKVPTAQEDQK